MTTTQQIIKVLAERAIKAYQDNDLDALNAIYDRLSPADRAKINQEALVSFGPLLSL